MFVLQQFYLRRRRRRRLVGLAEREREREREREMGGFELQVKERAKGLKDFFKKGMKVVGDSCKKGWYKVKKIRG